MHALGAEALLPIARIASAGGPINTSPASRTAWAKRAFLKESRNPDEWLRPGMQRGFNHALLPR